MKDGWSKYKIAKHLSNENFKNTLKDSMVRNSLQDIVQAEESKLFPEIQ